MTVYEYYLLIGERTNKSKQIVVLQFNNNGEWIPREWLQPFGRQKWQKCIVSTYQIVRQYGTLTLALQTEAYPVVPTYN